MTTLADLGHTFNEKGHMVDTETGGGFEFNKFNNRAKNQERYEQLGDAVTETVYQLLEDEGLERRYFPQDEGEKEGKSFVFVSKDLAKDKKCLVLINGSGVVRAGQWARSVIMNHDLYSGSMLPYIRQGVSEGYSVLVMNTNENIREGVRLTGSHTAEEHAQSVWEEFLSEHLEVYIVAHSYGGVVVQDLIKNVPGVKERVKRIGLTDSVHFTARDGDPNCEWFTERAVNWVGSKLELDTEVRVRNRFHCRCRSAGTTEHVWTSAKSVGPVFRWLGGEGEETKEEDNKDGEDEKGVDSGREDSEKEEL